MEIGLVVALEHRGGLAGSIEVGAVFEHEDNDHNNNRSSPSHSACCTLLNSRIPRPDRLNPRHPLG